MIRPTRSIDPEFLAKGVFTRRPLGSALTGTAAAEPDGLALVEGARRIAWRELDQRADACARRLRALGVGAHDVVTVNLPSWWEAVVAMHALLKLGAVNNPVVPIYRDAELRFILEQARPRAVVTPHRFRNWDYVEMFARLTGAMDDPPTIVVVRPEGRLPAGFVEFEAPAEAGDAVESATDPSEICLLLYTSGTTAEPKGVLHSHQTLDYAARAIAARCGLRPGETIFMPSPVSHITGYLVAILLPAQLASPCVLMDVWNPERAREIVEAEKCRFTAAATPFLQGLLDAYAAAGETGSALNSFCCGGADVPADLIRASRERLAEKTSRAYGSSEFPAYSMAGPGFDERICSETDGMPITEDCEARLDDPVDGVGEILLRGPQMCLGYLDGSLNEDAFTHDGFFRTGDLARIGPQGEVTIVGRKKDVILRGGENISAKQVEEALYRHPSVREAAVVAMPDPVLVERVCAFVVAAENGAPTLAELKAHLEAEGLAKQKWPERLEIVAALPTTPAGKVQKFVLRREIRDRLAHEANG